MIRKKRKEKKKQKQQQWLQIRKEVSNLIKDINFEEEMEEDESNESMEIESSEQEEMEISQEEMKNVTPIVKFSTLLLMMYLKQKETSKTPIIQPFSSDEEKTPVQVSYLLKYSNHKWIFPKKFNKIYFIVTMIFCISGKRRKANI